MESHATHAHVKWLRYWGFMRVINYLGVSASGFSTQVGFTAHHCEMNVVQGDMKLRRRGCRTIGTGESADVAHAGSEYTSSPTSDKRY